MHVLYCTALFHIAFWQWVKAVEYWTCKTIQIYGCTNLLLLLLLLLLCAVYLHLVASVQYHTKLQYLTANVTPWLRSQLVLVVFLSSFSVNLLASRMPFSDWPHYSLSIVLLIVNSLAQERAQERFQVSLKRIKRKFWTTSRLLLKQFEFSLSISICDSGLGLRPCQLSRDRNIEVIILLSNRKTSFCTRFVTRCFLQLL